MKRYITAFLLIIGCILIYISTFATNTILSQDYILNKAEENNYYQNVYENVHQNFTNYTMQSGLEDYVVQDIVTVDKIKADTNIIINNYYSGSNETIETDSIKETLEQKITNFLQENNLKVEDKSSIDKFENLIIEQYKNNINDYPKQRVNIYNIIVKARNIAQSMKGIGIIIIVITLVLFVLLNRKKLNSIIAICGMVSTFFGIVLLIIKLAVVDINNLYILNNPISEVLKLMANEILTNICIQGIILSLVGLILIVLGNFIESRKKLSANLKSENGNTQK